MSEPGIRMQVQAHPCRATIKAPTEKMTGTRGFQQAGCRYRDAGRTCHHIQKTRGHSCPDRAGRPVRRRHPPIALQAPSLAPFRFRRGARCRSLRFTAAMDSITKGRANNPRNSPSTPKATATRTKRCNEPRPLASNSFKVESATPERSASSSWVQPLARRNPRNRCPISRVKVTGLRCL